MQDMLPFQHDPTRVSNVCDVNGAAISTFRDVRQGRKVPHLHNWPDGPRFQIPAMHRQAIFCDASSVSGFTVHIAAVPRPSRWASLRNGNFGMNLLRD